MEKLIKAFIGVLPQKLQDIYYKYEEKWLYLLFGGAAIGEFGRLTALYLPLLLFAAGVAGGRDRIFAKPIPYACFALTAMGAMVLTAILRSTLKLVIVDGGGW